MDFEVTKLGVFAGYSIQGLLGLALEHEQEKEFKAAFVTFLKTKIPTYDETIWADFPDTPSGFLYYLETGTAAISDIKMYLGELLLPAPGTGNMVIGPVIEEGCDNSPEGWERSRTVTVAQGGVKLTTGGVADEYSSKLTSPLSAKLNGELSAMDIHFTVRWTASEK